MVRYYLYKAFLVVWGLIVMASSVVALFGIDTEGILLSLALGVTCGSAFAIGFHFFLWGIK